jgi:hypothetical protein
MFSRLLVAFLLLASPAWAMTDGEIEEAIQNTIAQRHPKDDASFWRGLGPSAPRIMISMYERAGSLYQRLRLVEALGYFGDAPVAMEFARRQAENAREDVVRNGAIKAVGAGQGAAAVEFVSRYLGHEDAQTRLTAAQTLRKIDDPQARARVDRFMKEEKAAWLVAKLRGELPKPTAKLTPVASTEDRVSPAFAGTWRGYWLLPRPGPSGLRSEAAVLRLSIEGANELKGELLIGSKDKVRAVPLARVQGKGLKVSGALGGVAVPGGGLKKPKPEVAFEAELREVMGHAIVELRAPGAAGLLVVRRDPPKE